MVRFFIAVPYIHHISTTCQDESVKAVALEMKPFLAEEARARQAAKLKQNQRHTPLASKEANGEEMAGRTTELAAKSVGVSKSTVERVDRLKAPTAQRVFIDRIESAGK